jgi:urease accessory protein
MTVPDAAARLKLQAWLSPAYPVGGFAYSQGLEAAEAAGDLDGAPALESWLSVALEDGTLRNEAILVALAWRAARDPDPAALRDVSDLAVALAAGRERRLETTAQGRAFERAVGTSWPVAGLAERYASAGPGPLAYPVAVAIAAASHAIPLAATLEAYLCAALSSAVSAASRLGVVGQTDAQATLARLLARIPAIAESVARAGPDDLGSATVRAEILCFHHEDQYSRLFRS